MTDETGGHDGAGGTDETGGHEGRDGTDEQADTADDLAEELLAELEDTEKDAVDVETDGTDANVAADADDDSVSSTFLVTHADEESAVLRDAHSGQVHTLSENPDLAAEEIVDAAIAPEPPMGVTYEVLEVRDQCEVEIATVVEEPTTQASEIAAEQSVGEVTRQERAGKGELHVITVPKEQTETAVEDVTADRETRLLQAARAGASLVEVRSEPGVVVVRYLP
jgi:hypothetical protein